MTQAEDGARSRVEDQRTIQRHLLTEYGPTMPANPRLIKRVANTVGMLEALGAHLSHGVDDDTRMRAAILFVRFPSLVADLLDASAAPNSGADRRTRPDVRQVIGPASLPEIAACFGKVYAADDLDT